VRRAADKLRSANVALAHAIVVDRYRLISVRRAPAPTGDAGDDWLAYRIEQGINVVTGYRRGNPQNVTAEVERIVAALNERQFVAGQVYRAERRPVNAPPRHKDLL
jgi:hypothetical protein